MMRAEVYLYLSLYTGTYVYTYLELTFLSSLIVIIAKISCIIAYEPIESKL
jgi:hypothetical protein